MVFIVPSFYALAIDFFAKSLADNKYNTSFFLHTEMSVCGKIIHKTSLLPLACLQLDHIQTPLISNGTKEIGLSEDALRDALFGSGIYQFDGIEDLDT